MTDAGESPTCGDPATWHGTPCGFPVDAAHDRCYRHEDGACRPDDQPVAFLDRAPQAPPEAFVDAVAADPDDRGPVLAELYVRYARQVRAADAAVQLTITETDLVSLEQTLLAEGLFEATTTEGGTVHQKSRPELRQVTRTSQRLRQLRRLFGLTAHDDESAGTAVRENLWRSQS